MNQKPSKDILTTAIWQLHQDLNWGQIQSVVRHAREAMTRQADCERKTEALKQCYKELNRAMNTGLDPSVATDASIAACNARAALGIPLSPKLDDSHWVKTKFSDSRFDDRDSDSVPLDVAARGKA